MLKIKTDLSGNTLVMVGCALLGAFDTRLKALRWVVESGWDVLLWVQ